MAEGKTITIIQKGKAVNEVTITLSFHAQQSDKTCFIVTPKVNGATQSEIRAESYGSYVQKYALKVPKNASVQLTGKTHWCESGNCKKADGTVVHNCFDALADNYANARFDGNTTLSFTASSDRNVDVTWT